MRASVQRRMAEYLSGHRKSYPGILEWFNRVIVETESDRRGVIIEWINNEIAGVAITKRGEYAKLCHISVLPAARGHGVGSHLLKRALRDMWQRGAREVIVTTGEDVYRDHKRFFRRIGFKPDNWVVGRYRKSMAEIIWRMTLEQPPQNLDQVASLGIPENLYSYSTSTTEGAQPSTRSPCSVTSNTALHW